jgi:hypothetical protein
MNNALLVLYRSCDCVETYDINALNFEDGTNISKNLEKSGRLLAGMSPISTSCLLTLSALILLDQF